MGKFYCTGIMLCDFNPLQFVLWPVILKSPTQFWAYLNIYSPRQKMFDKCYRETYRPYAMF